MTAWCALDYRNARIIAAWLLRHDSESSPISEDQLAAEIKGIHASFATVGAKCIDIDAERTGDSHVLGLSAVLQELLHEFWRPRTFPAFWPDCRSMRC